MFKLLYHPRTIKFLKKLPEKERNMVLAKAEKLRANPFGGALNIKKPATTRRSYRLRVGAIRLIYELDPQAKIIYIHDIDFRGNIY